MAKVTKNADGTIDISHKVAAERVAVVNHLFRDPAEVAAEVEAELTKQHTEAMSGDALAKLKEAFEAGETGLPFPYDVPAVVAWYVSRADYETRWQKEDRLKAEAEAAKAAAEAEAMAAEEELLA